MKALLLNEATNPPKMNVGDFPKPVPGKGELLVKIHACAINPADYKIAYNFWPVNFSSKPWILGLDGSGVVEATGEGVDDFKPGDEVVYHGSFSKLGTFAEYGCVNHLAAFHKPKQVSHVEAAAIPCAGLTAYQGLFRKANVKPDDVVLVLGAAGGVGGFAVQLASSIGCRVIGTCSPEHFDFVRSLGCSDVIDYRKEDVAKRVLELTNGRGVDVVFDSVGPEAQGGIFNMVAFNGRIVCVLGLLDISSYQKMSKAVSVHEVMLGGAHSSGDQKAIKDLAKMGEEMISLMEKGKIKPMVTEVTTLDGIPDAFVKLLGRHVHGKIVAKLI